MDIPVLKYVDILIGLSLVMVLVSTVVLAATQVLLNSTFARPRHLQRGLRRLLLHVDPSSIRDHTPSIRDHTPYLSALLVRHPLIGRQTMFTPVRKFLDVRRAKHVKAGKNAWRLPPIKPGSVVQREELAYLLIEFAAGEGPLMDPAETGETPPAIVEVQAALAKALRAAGIEDPAATLRAIRLKIVENERANPDQPATRWRAEAVTDCATSDFIGKLHASFDSTMARVIDGFTAESKLWVSAVALLVAIALQLDSIALIKRLSVDDAYRETFVQVASDLNEQHDALNQERKAIIKRENEAEGLPADARRTPSPEVTERNIELASNQESMNKARESLKLLGSPKIDLLPPMAALPATASVGEKIGVYLPDVEHLPGVLVSWLLLSLGAPFWFDALKNLLKLRSLLAKKDDADRDRRETTQPPEGRGPSHNAPGAPIGIAAGAAGEAGDLTATGAAG